MLAALALVSYACMLFNRLLVRFLVYLLFFQFTERWRVQHTTDIAIQFQRPPRSLH